MKFKNYPDKSVAILSVTSGTGEIGGAERLYQGLLNAIEAKVGRAELISLPADESSFENILDNYKEWKNLDLSEFDLVISTKAPTYAVDHPRHILYLIHTIRVFYDMFEEAFGTPSEIHLEQKSKIHALDNRAFANISNHFSIGQEVSDRLQHYNGVKAEVLHPPLLSDDFREGESEGYFLMPGRLHAWKRVHLAIEAVRCSSAKLKLLIAGTGEEEPQLRSLADGDDRIEFLGYVTDDQLRELYAKALAVIFIPIREDYGYVTLEAFKSGKPVITCRDSGEPLQFVRNNQTGYVCDPDAESIANAMRSLLANPEQAMEMGNAGRHSIEYIRWDNVAGRLLDAGFGGEFNQPAQKDRHLNVAILDMQPIDPPVGGGRLRLLGLYHALGGGISARYVGSYDWPGEAYRRHCLTESLEEIDVPLSSRHHKAAQKLAGQCGGKVVIDLAFPRLGHLSNEYLDEARDAIEWADVVVFSHPWIYPLLKQDIPASKLVVYDSHNVEGFLRAELLDQNNPPEKDLLRDAVGSEFEVGERAALILACSNDDARMFTRVYGWNHRKIRVIPNGIMSSVVTPASKEQKLVAKDYFKLDPSRAVGIFIGSAYGPNIEAAEFIANDLASCLPEIEFVIAGGVGESLSTKNHDNLHVTGFLSEEERLLWLQAADFAINPMFSGSGTNIKMFDFMSAGLPVVSTEIGARGIEGRVDMGIVVLDGVLEAFAQGVRSLVQENQFADLGFQARKCVEDGYSWERISPLVGDLMRKRVVTDEDPLFSVVIPSYERHSQLDELMECLKNQVETDFEVIVVDQSSEQWTNRDGRYGFDLLYHHTPVKGAVRARNTGATLARGSFIAFTDDDCRPDPTWLCSARHHILENDVIGIEGRIVSDHLDDPAYRPVTNVGFEGIGFMTANLIVKMEAFQALGGFDLGFDQPHFREDTDLGWRLQELGQLPYVPEVTVFHPAQPRDIARESSAERCKFFVKDALLYKKHKERYRELFFLECHYQNTEGFEEWLQHGFEQFGLEMPDWMTESLQA